MKGEFCLCCSKNWRITSAKLMTTKTCLYSDNDRVTLDNHRPQFQQLSLGQLAPKFVFTRSSALIYNHYAKHKQYTIKTITKKTNKKCFHPRLPVCFILRSHPRFILTSVSKAFHKKYQKCLIKEHKITKLLHQKPWEVTTRQCIFINIRKVPIMIKK